MKNFLKNFLLQIAFFGLVCFVIFVVIQYIFGISLENINGAVIILFFTLPLGIAFYIPLLFKHKLKIHELFLPDILLFFVSLLTPPGKPSNEFLAVDNRGLMGSFFICVLSAQILAIIVYLAVKLIVKIRKKKKSSRI
jgi:predicted neutral ceramidase superfamily lipid hydrolase